MSRSHAVWAFALGLLSLMPATVAGKSVGQLRDVAWSHPQIDRLRPRQIALLPVVSFIDDAPAARCIQDSWMRAFHASGHLWRSATDCRARMARATRERDGMYQTLVRQVRAAGKVDSATAASLCRVVDSPSIMIVRVDQWERVDGVAQLEMRATLMDSAGGVLWTCSGRSGAGRRSTGGYAEVSPSRVQSQATGYSTKLPPPQAEPPGASKRGGAPSEDPSYGVVAGVERDFTDATGLLLARWVTLLPQAPEARKAARP
jgi:hypothetical protein